MNLNRSNYFNLLINLSSKISRKVVFSRFSLNLRQLKRLIAAYKHVRVLRLPDCILSVPSAPDFSKALTNCQIQELDLSYSGESYSSDWENNLDEFKNLVEGLASSPDLRLSIRRVSILGCLITQNEAEQIFAVNELEQVKIMDGN
ncbi:unnamed protein product [Moneuplotes crassus]|uniref:Uncharacterized protein n=1 Tax=Euplotes crassus TaxID=5936 RepID=A0AAD1XDG6_EUPCR|nr:unnamed protein product [Moneuplotes crassus]